MGEGSGRGGGRNTGGKLESVVGREVCFEVLANGLDKLRQLQIRAGRVSLEDQIIHLNHSLK